MTTCNSVVVTKRFQTPSNNTYMKMFEPVLDRWYVVTFWLKWKGYLLNILLSVRTFVVLRYLICQRTSHTSCSDSLYIRMYPLYSMRMARILYSYYVVVVYNNSSTYHRIYLSSTTAVNSIHLPLPQLSHIIDWILILTHFIFHLRINTD